MMLKGKTALVTGGSRGIGAAIARKLSAEGARVYLTYVMEKDAAGNLADEINGTALYMDVRSRDTIRKAIHTVASESGCLHILVNNAGINKPTDFDQIQDVDWDEVMAVNLRGPFLCTQEALGLLKKAGGSSVVNIGSVSGQYGGPRTAHYAASKAGLISLSQVIARFGASYGIRSNTLAAGLIESEMAQQGMQSKTVAAAAENIVLKRFGTQAEVGDVVAFLASDASSYITAQTINVNGGLYF